VRSSSSTVVEVNAAIRVLCLVHDDDCAQHVEGANATV
jgi:hypothetical protein